MLLVQSRRTLQGAVRLSAGTTTNQTEGFVVSPFIAKSYIR